MPPPSADIILPARGPFDLRATVLSHGGWRLPPWTWSDGPRPALRRAEVLADGAVRLLEIRPHADGVILRVTGRSAAEPEVLAPLAARVRIALQLDTDLRPFHRWCRTQTELRPVARLRLGRFLRGTTLFEDLVATIVRQRVPLHADRLVALGARCPADRRLRTFPTAERVDEVGVRGLRLLGLGTVAVPLARLARDVTSGRLDLFALERASPRALRAIPGVDASAAGWIGLLLGHVDGPLVDGRSARRLAAWAPWRGLALWWALWLACPLPEQERLRAPLRTRRRPGSQSRRS
jgi:hypothetical protein